MAPFPSAAPTLCLHAVRLLGGADESRVAARFRLDREATHEMLLDFEAAGWTARTDFGGTRAWSLTDAGRVENDKQLRDELDASGARGVVAQAYATFESLNGAFLRAATDWQLRPMPGLTMAPNDHTDLRWDDRVIERLVSVGIRLGPVAGRLSGALARFDGYAARYDAAVQRVSAGEWRWVDALEVDSCHVVWMQLHEDLLATLGRERGKPR